jgi:hypothetical protein
MARPKLDPKIKKARYEKAQREAKKLNKKLPSPHVYAYATESGKLVVYYEPPGSPKVRIHSRYPSTEFHIELAAAKSGEPLQMRPKLTKPRAQSTAISPGRNGYAEGTLGWLFERYFKEDDEWQVFTDQKRREIDLRLILTSPINPQTSLVFGDMPLEHFNAGSVRTLMQLKRQKQQITDFMTGKTRPIWTNPEAANQRRKWLSNVLQFAVNKSLIAHNYVKDVPKAHSDKLGKGESEDGFPTWPIWLIAAYREVHKPGTLARLVFELALYTTARKADIPRIGVQFLQKDRKGRDTLIYIQHKNRNKKPVKVYQPIWPELQVAIDNARRAGILGQLLYVVQKPGTNRERAYSENTVANYMQDWVAAALAHVGEKHPPGPNGYSLHGLRKAGICNLILKGVPDRWIMAISGHRDPRLITLYGRQFMREFGAEGAFDIWMRDQTHEAFTEDEFERREFV